MEQSLCELCRAQGLTSQLILFQLNLDEAILLCKNKECVYPLGVAPNSNLFVRRKYSEISNTKRRKKRKEQRQIDIQTWNSAPVIVRHVDSYLQWQNTGALCWLDSVLSSFVHNRTLECFLQRKVQNEDCLLKDLFASFSKAQEMCSANREQAEKVLEDARQRVWTYLQPKMNCKLGVNDSAVTALLLLLKENCIISKETLQEYYWEFSCSVCGYQQIDRRKKHLVTFANVTGEFSLQDAVFLRSCYKCGVPGQRSKLVYERIPQCIYLHFENGLKSNKLLYSDFNGVNGCHHVTQLLQYKRNPDHFVLWIKEHKGDKWMEIDDLKSPLCRWETSFPSVPTSEIHIVVLEKPCTDPHHLVTVPASKNLGGQTDSVQGALAKEVLKDCSRSKDCATLAMSLNSKDLKNSHGNQVGTPVSSTGSPVLAPSLPLRTVSQLSTFPQKTKAGPLVFEPYVPRKKRPVAHSCPNSPIDVNGFKCDADRDMNAQFSSPLSPSFLSWQELSEQSKAKMNHSYLQSDSGYSSPASVSSCSSLPSTQSGVSLATSDSWDDVHLEESVDTPCASDFLENDSNAVQLLSVTDRPEEKPSDLCPSDNLANKLEELLPDCLLENSIGLVKSTEDDMNMRLDEFQKLSAEQDQFILDLLAT